MAAPMSQRPALARDRVPADRRGGTAEPAPPVTRQHLCVLLCYLLATAALTRSLWPDPAHRAVAGNPHDTDLYCWWLSYWAHQVSGGHLDLISHAMNAPMGVNAMWNTSLLLPGVLLTPLTLTAGAQASYNLLVVTGFAGSAFTAYLLLRRHASATPWTAAAGGALYGFAPAMVHAAVGHVSLLFAPLVPLLVSATLDLARGRREPLRGGAHLGVLAAAQLLIGEELLYDTVMATGLLLLLAIAAHPRQAPRHVGRLVRGVAAATIVGGSLTAYPLWVQLEGPLAQHGSAFTHDFFTADLTGFVTADRMMAFHSEASAAAAAAYRGGQPEYLAYLGWPLLVLLAFAVVVGRRHPPLSISSLMSLLLAALSLGVVITNHGHSTHLRGPWALLRHLPLAANALPTRLGLLVPLAASATLAIVLTQLQREWSTITAVAIAAVVMLPIIPSPLRTARIEALPPSAVDVLRRLPADSTTLIVPFPTATRTAPMRWQSQTGFRFSMPGGYFTGPAADGHAYIGGDAARPTEALLSNIASGRDQLVTKQDRIAALADLAYWQVDRVALLPASHHAAFADALIALLGEPDTRRDHVMIWWIDQRSMPRP
jgi:hypothetical protein